MVFARVEDQWHLCKTNWQGEASATLDDGKSTLEACGVNDGDYLVVEFGSLVSRLLTARFVSCVIVFQNSFTCT